MKKKITIISIITITLILIALFICYQKGYLFQPKEEDFKYSPPTYEICDEDSCIYLLGSIHIGDDKVTHFNNSIKEYYNKSKYLAVELDIQEIDVTSTIDDYLLENGETIDNKISEELKNKIINFLENKNSMYTYTLLSKFKLGFINSYISLLATTELNMTESGVDNYFLTLAHEENKEIISLETYEEQMDLILNYSDEIYINQINESIDNYEEMKKSLKELYQSYINEDIKKLEELINEDSSVEEDNYTLEEKEYIKAMYSDRNIKMANNIEQFLSENKEVFMIVGAAHVLGDDGIVDLLQNKNYKIELVK